jgi:glycolate oxidase iron-sulfur subunit
MKTSYSKEQLKDPLLAEAERIVRKCVHCGLCTATCPSYVVLGDERASPRGRIYLIKAMLEKSQAPSKATVHFIDNCLGCLSCMTTCPSGVDYRHLLDMARERIEEKARRPLHRTFSRRMLARLLPHPGRLSAMMWAGRLARPLAPLAKRAHLKTIVRMYEALPPLSLGRARYDRVNLAIGKPIGRVALLPGCISDLMRNAINEATVQLLTRMGVEVLVPAGLGCCGAIEHQLGETAHAIRSAKRNVDVLSKLHAETPLDAIILTASGCGSEVKDYPHLLRHEPGYAQRASDIARITRDVSEILPKVIREAPRHWGDIKVAYHAACSLEHGQGVRAEPRRLLERAGFNLVEIPEGHLCCGAAGTYGLLQPEISDALRNKKLANIAPLEPDIIATGHVGCINHLAKGTRIPIVHTVELINWAYGGKCPSELRHLESRVETAKGLMADTQVEKYKQRA